LIEPLRAKRAARDIAQPLATTETSMRARAIATIASAFTRAFPASSLQAGLLRQIALLAGAVLFVWLLSLTHGLDLSAGFF
jgi:hypothetical protein